MLCNKISTHERELKGKLDSLFHNIQTFKPSCITPQETKLRFPGTVKIEGYEKFENIREGLGGGLLTAVYKDINSVLISSGNDDFEAFLVELAEGEKKLRISNCYGPQQHYHEYSLEYF